MKQLVKLFSIVFCAMALYACGSDDEPGKSALQDQFIDVDNSEYTEGSIPVGNTPMLQAATFDKSSSSRRDILSYFKFLRRIRLCKYWCRRRIWIP